jgi:hypothetical protein
MLALVTSSTTAFADKEPTAKQRSKAKKLVAQAQAAFQNEDFELCAEKFSSAYDLAPLPQIQFNLGMCYEKLEQFRNAALAYEGAAESEKMSPGMRRKARENLNAMHDQMAKIRFEGVEGEGVIDGSIPCEIPCSLYLEPGEHEIRYGDDQTQSFSATRGRVLKVVLREQEFDATAPDPDARTDLTTTATTSSEGGPGWLTWGGAGIAAAGTTGAIVFGLKTQSLHEDFMAAPSVDVADEGVQMRRFTNVSIGVAAVGASLVIYDLLTD